MTCQQGAESLLSKVMEQVTEILHAIQAGEPQAAGKLLPLVYEELRRLAAQKLAREPSGQTLQPTALVHEAYLRLVGVEEPRRWDSVGHFFAAAAEAMRRILIEAARRKRRRPACLPGIEEGLLPDRRARTGCSAEELLDLDELLDRLAEQDPRKAALVKLRFYGGLSVEDAARCLNISRATADRDWTYARAWLYGQLRAKRKG
jgi:RNA polymerase sigma factor (TIGR02999 family)